MIGRLLNKYNILIPIAYILLNVVYRLVSKVFYADIFVNLSWFFYMMILISLYLRDRFKEGTRTTYHAVHMLIIMVFLMLFVTSLPEYTYKEAQRLVEISSIDAGTSLDPKDDVINFLIDPPIKHVESSPRLLTNHVYLIYFHSDTNNDLKWYQLDPYTGKYDEVEPITGKTKE